MAGGIPPDGIHDGGGGAVPEVSVAGIGQALVLVAGCYVAAAALSPFPSYGVQPTFAVSLNAGIVGGLCVLPSRRQLPAFLLLVAVVSVAIWRPTDGPTLGLALLFTAVNMPSVALFRVLMLRFADAGRQLDTHRRLLTILVGCVTAVAVNAVAVLGLVTLARSGGWLPASTLPTTAFVLGERPAAQLAGLVTIAPLVWTLTHRRPGSWPRRAWLEIGWWLVVLVSVSAAAIEVRQVAPLVPLLLVVSFAGLVFAVLRQGRLAAAALCPAFGVLAATVLLSWAPPDGTRWGSSPALVLLSQLAGFIAAILAWAVSTVITERDQARRQAHTEAAAQAALTSLQTALLPPIVRSGPGVRVAARYRAADAFNQIGGDWYDTIALPGGGTALVIGDVEGHDLTAASVMGLVRGAVRSYALEGHPPSMVLDRVNTFLISAGVDRLVTMIYAQLYPHDTIATVALGGHPAPMVVPQGGAGRVLDVRAGPLLGLEGLGGWPEQTVWLPPEATLVLYTDGLVDYPGAGQDRQAQMAALATDAAATSVEALANALITTAPPYDDAAVLAARLTSRNCPGAERTFPAQPISVSIARVWLADMFDLWQIAGKLTQLDPTHDATQTAELLLTELMAIAIRHGDGAVTVRLLLRAQRLRVEVVDSSERMPSLRRSNLAADAPGGRGLLLVDALSTAWGTQPDQRGKAVWCEVSLIHPIASYGPAQQADVEPDNRENYADARQPSGHRINVLRQQFGHDLPPRCR